MKKYFPMITSMLVFILLCTISLKSNSQTSTIKSLLVIFKKIHNSCLIAQANHNKPILKHVLKEMNSDKGVQDKLNLISIFFTPYAINKTVDEIINPQVCSENNQDLRPIATALKETVLTHMKDKKSYYNEVHALFKSGPYSTLGNQSRLKTNNANETINMRYRY